MNTQTNTSNKYVIYLRVSTKQQGDSGLGLEAQQQYIDNFFLQCYRGNTNSYTVIETISDVMSGKGSIEDRPSLKRAVELCSKHNANLLVAKLDRVSRDVETVARLIKAVNLKVATMPQADNFQLHIYSALAEQERKFISERTKSAMKVLKEKGVKVGAASPKYHRDSNNKTTRQTQHHTKYEELRTIFEVQVKRGVTPTQLTIKLNDIGKTTPNGGMWTPTQVTRVIKYLGLKQ